MIPGAHEKLLLREIKTLGENLDKARLLLERAEDCLSDCKLRDEIQEYLKKWDKQ